ncbi:class I SAM-dependent methyltransferase [Pseudonocardia sp. H11422]|uniref:class I SAM-dependent methyltransferase n=1 Tax=Pseudonocardia sp. H11422 TaxID=2835866 RepID=UPI001BDD79F0|nr:class I SAM-dependent methyltransferase [Pseudonocardia sp. H11422]
MSKPSSSPASAPVDRPRRVFSRFYARISERMEAEGMAALRRELLAELAGEVAEVGAGNGLNFVHYPSAVARVVAVEPEPYLRGLATRAAGVAPVPVAVRAGTADRLPLPDRSVDAAVLCLVMCSLDDRAAALAELARVLRPGGTLRFLEHTIADSPGLRAVQRIADVTVWPLLAGGCHTATDPVGLISAAGFEITTCRRLRFPANRMTQPSSPHVLGSARAPE